MWVLDSNVGSLKQLWTLYNSHVLSQFTYAAEICVGYSTELEDSLNKFHKSAIRFIMGVHPRATTKLFAKELKTVSIPHRLTILTLKYVKHALESSSPPLMAALETIWLMSKNGNGWLKCLKDTLARQLHLKWDISSLDTIKKHINENIALAQKIAFKKLDDEYKALSKTSRLRAITRYGQKGELKKYGYMETLLPYGRALAKIRISAHRLAVERRRYIARVDRTERWCTKCKAKDIHAIEDERHIVFDCEEFTEVRTALWKKMDMNKEIKEYREGYVRLRLKEEGASVVTWLSLAWKVKLLKLFIDLLDKSEALLVGRYWAKALKRIDQRYIN
ncbi:hypothetical protein BJ508DRAFT_315078 [Ascobolus immersus RN42]|uniref:Reverse transcriptase zinc-binding domain-containing protein n=1 Tax=Ascobolus immersus RN42 TaxID=1160509 RepID=A0A3N4HIH1_ASCIM|nr:hypothetical protein BJ508DRAFT_315078 [Ascobolus immersus RN42]